MIRISARRRRSGPLRFQEGWPAFLRSTMALALQFEFAAAPGDLRA
jgi:hypothetical protein